jgi:hypothetical protein
LHGKVRSGSRSTGALREHFMHVMPFFDRLRRSARLRVIRNRPIDSSLDNGAFCVARFHQVARIARSVCRAATPNRLTINAKNVFPRGCAEWRARVRRPTASRAPSRQASRMPLRTPTSRQERHDRKNMARVTVNDFISAATPYS